VSYSLNQDWKSGWIPPLFTIVAILGFRFWKLGLVLLPFGIFPASRLISFGIAADEYSYSTRLDAWTIILEMVKINPVLGFGPANYRWYTPLFPIRGWFVQFNSHSQYIDLIAQTGLLGLVCFLWFFGTVGWVGWQLRERPFFYNVTLSGFRASVLGWLFLGGLVALGQIYSGRASMTPKD
jgi:O-antigen ligase